MASFHFFWQALAKEKAGKGGVVLCYGSLYMLGDIVNAARA